MARGVLLPLVLVVIRLRVLCGPSDAVMGSGSGSWLFLMEKGSVFGNDEICWPLLPGGSATCRHHCGGLGE
jgi:hypothetical protein